MNQLTFLDPPPPPPPLSDAAKDAAQRELWQLCGNWAGPEVGKVVSFEGCLVADVEGRLVYVQMAPATVTAIDGDYYHLEFRQYSGTAWDGPLHKFKLRAHQIWPHHSHFK